LREGARHIGEEVLVKSRNITALLATLAALLLPAAQTSSHAQIYGHPLPFPWQSADIGDVGTPGTSVQGADADLYMAGAGSDIWGTADSFYFVYQTALDGAISALVGDEENTDPFAKTGVMIRQSLDPGAPHVILDVKPDGGVEFMTRSSLGGATTYLGGTSVPVTQYESGDVGIYATLKLMRSAGTVTAIVCAARTCQTVGSIPWPSGPMLFGVAVTSHNPSVLNHAYFPAAMPTVTRVPDPWFSYDIGAVGQSGRAFFEDGTFTVEGAGADIWGVNDSFHFVQQWIVGSAEIVARVTSEQDTQPYAKAGVLIRDSSGTATVILDVKPDGGIEFMSRPTTGGQMAFVAGASASFPIWLKLTRVGSDFTGAISSDGMVWQPVGTTTATMSANSAAGIAVTSHDTSQLNTATFDHVSLISEAVQDVDIGAVGQAGTESFSDGVYTIKGAGADIWGTADAFNYLYGGLIGDGQLVTRVTSEQNTDDYAKAGVMVRESTNPDAPDVILDVKPDGGVEFMTRDAAGGSTTFLGGASLLFPVWLKLTRTGSTVTGYVSSDGLTWTLVGSTPFSVAGHPLIGLAVTSHDPSVLNTATFDHVSR
jgi:regulation of enolase protein 1 (concanavalin A-like superfamily)